MPSKIERSPSSRRSKPIPVTAKEPKQRVRKVASPNKTQIIQVRMSPDITIKASMVLESIGLNVSEAFRLFLVKVAQDKQLPFEPVRTPNKETLAAIREVERGKLKRFGSVGELMADLNDED